MRLFQRHIVGKLSLLLVATVSIGFVVLTYVNTQRQWATMRASQERMAISMARGVSTGLRNAMLAGTALTVEDLLKDTRQRLPEAEIRIYAPTGAVIFEPPPPRVEIEIPPFVKQTLDNPEQRTLEDGTTVTPLVNEDRCQFCHDEGKLRGVLSLRTAIVDAADKRGLAVAEVARVAFVQLMSAGHENGINALFEEISRTSPGLRSVSVLSLAGTVSFGDKMLAPTELHKQALASRKPVVDQNGGSMRWAIPLENSPRCQNCHEALPEFRGTLIATFEAEPNRTTMITATKVALDHVMLAGLGRLVTSFLDEAAATNGFESATLFDEEGKLYHTTQSKNRPMPVLVEKTLSTGKAFLGHFANAQKPRLTYVEPLKNDAACQRCHGTGKPLRGAIEVTVDTSREHEEQRALLARAGASGGVTILVVLVALYLGLRRTVLRPVLDIGAVAERVGEGELNLLAPVHSEDEIGRLATRINQMIDGLRKKLELAKFVSDETLRTVDAAEGKVDRSGQRRNITVLFSDIRGFTAYSEKHEPEKVVEMLNHYLSAQAEVVARYGGDIDKYVGDELMARFSGDDMERRAILCGVEMVEAARALAAREDLKLAIGVGINAGGVVIGAMGSTARMDFTVIGDAVNVAARLCSAASADQVLVSSHVAGAAGEIETIEFKKLEPLALKGKSEPFPVMSAIRKA